MNSEKNICPHFVAESHGAFACGGCDHWNIDYPAELHSKKELLKSKLNLFKMNIRVKNTPDKFDLRTRFDFTIIKELGEFKCGLYSKFDKKIVDIKECYVIKPELQKAYTQFVNLLKKVNPDIKKGSVRLRIAENTEEKLIKWGVWLDLSNEDIKKLLVNKTFLMALSVHFLIEIGQKKKRLDLGSFQSIQLKLTDPILEPWFKTFNQTLNCSISSFTQPCSETADLISMEILGWVAEVKPLHVIEYGCGIGQYTIPILQNNYHVDVYENDLTALECLKINTSPMQQTHLRINPKEDSVIQNSLALVNPSRSGLGNFAEKLMSPQFESIIYISCYVDSLKKDLDRLEQQFEVVDVFLVDQFKRTSHFEAGVLLKRKPLC